MTPAAPFPPLTEKLLTSYPVTINAVANYALTQRIIATLRPLVRTPKPNSLLDTRITQYLQLPSANVVDETV